MMERRCHMLRSVKDRVLTSVVAGVDANSFVAMLTALVKVNIVDI